jgi:predicted PurR-regulated permease PerM
MNARWACAAFASIGLLTGLLTGMTSSSVVTAVLGLVFALLGGSIVAFVQKLTVAQQDIAVKCLLFLSLFCTLGVFCGIVITEHQLLSPTNQPLLRTNKEKESNPKTFDERKYLKEFLMDPAVNIDSKRRDGSMSADDAAKELFQLIQKIQQSQGKRE